MVPLLEGIWRLGECVCRWFAVYFKKISLQPDFKRPEKHCHPVDFFRLLTLALLIGRAAWLDAQVLPGNEKTGLEFKNVHLEQFKGECNSEKGCVAIVLDFPVVVKGPELLKSKSNGLVRKKIASTFGEVPNLSAGEDPLSASMRWFIEQWSRHGSNAGEMWLHHVEGELTLHTTKVAVIRLTIEQQSGLFMPIEQVSVCVIDLKTGKLMDPKGAIQDFKALSNLAENKLRQTLKGVSTVQESRLVLSQADFELEPGVEGVTLWFNPMSLKCCVLAPLEVFLPWSSLKGIIDRSFFF